MARAIRQKTKIVEKPGQLAFGEGVRGPQKAVRRDGGGDVDRKVEVWGMAEGEALRAHRKRRKPPQSTSIIIAVAWLEAESTDAG